MDKENMKLSTLGIIAGLLLIAAAIGMRVEQLSSPGTYGEPRPAEAGVYVAKWSNGEVFYGYQVKSSADEEVSAPHLCLYKWPEDATLKKSFCKKTRILIYEDGSWHKIPNKIGFQKNPNKP